MLGILVLIGFTITLALWARNLRIQRGIRWLALVEWLLWLGLLDAIIGTALGLSRAFRALQDANPAEKQTILADGISWAMWSTAIQLLVMIAALIVLFVIQIRNRR